MPVEVRTAGLALDLAAVKVVLRRELIRTAEDRLRLVAALVQPVQILLVAVVGTALLAVAVRAFERVE